MAIMGGAVARQSMAARAWFATCVYITIYGMGFLFLVGPASMQLANLGGATNQRFAAFGLWLVTAVVLTVGAALLHFTLDMMLERRYTRKDAPAWRIETAFAARGLAFAIIAAGLFVVVGALAVGGVSMPLVYAAVLAFLIPGALAGGFTHMITPTVMAEKRQMASVSGFALVVVVLSNYVMVGAYAPLASVVGS
ncbi:MAG: hypothetical protein CVT64_07855 [Actinobacteria bacterium HGW-Actinobacteria-4]|nr:MAG: hypothetical protein CVT64_07855 [Actinobacteria bacterium HGW-Actinobacteria-4]